MKLAKPLTLSCATLLNFALIPMKLYEIIV